MSTKLKTAQEAAMLVQTGDTVTIAGFVGTGAPEELLIALKNRFLAGEGPNDLGLLFAAAPGDGKERGLNHIAHKGLIKQMLAGHYGLAPKLGALARDGDIEAHNIPQGVISHMYREIASGKPGVLTRVGLETFADPRLEGGKINDRTTRDVAHVVDVLGEEFLYYKAPKVDVALLRGTTADKNGNISMEREALKLDNLAQAQAAKNCGGKVIVQVERILKDELLPSRQVEIPGALVDCIVVAEPENHVQTFATPYAGSLDGSERADLSTTADFPLSARKIMARRAAMELPSGGGVVNLGIGVPEGVAKVAAEQGWLDSITLTAEPGVIGGMPASGLDFGTAHNTEAIIAQNQQFDFYDGGGLSLAVLGMAELDALGNVNVSRFGTRLPGCGGFINISQNAQKVVFCGAFTAGGFEAEVQDGKLHILTEGQSPKIKDHVQQITFSGRRAARLGKPALYVTERCVFALHPEGLELIEIAPGVDLDRDILRHMPFSPIINDLREMDARIFLDIPMNGTGLLHAAN